MRVNAMSGLLNYPLYCDPSSGKRFCSGLMGPARLRFCPTWIMSPSGDLRREVRQSAALEPENESQD